MVKIAVIGGTGFSDKVRDGDKREIKTDYGTVDVGRLVLGGREVDLYSRHARLDVPHRVNYRAGMQAMMMQGTDAIIGLSAGGRLHDAVLPGNFMVVTGLTWENIPLQTFTDDGHLLLHASMAPPTSPALNALIHSAWGRIQGQVHPIYQEAAGQGVDLVARYHLEGVYHNIRGPYFLSPEQEEGPRNRHRDKPAAIVGQTLAYEMHLAKEAGIPYAGIAMAVDHSHHPGAPAHVDHKHVVKAAVQYTGRVAYILLDQVVAAIPEGFRDPACPSLGDILVPEEVNLAGLREVGRPILARLIEDCYK